jgi:protein-S-isoprenylcysteine O-methyltransferase Ste14
MALLGLAVFMALVLFWRGRSVISGNERPNCVICTGPFRYVRHPLYLAALLTYIGMAISSLSLISFALINPIYIFFNYIASYEEKLLEARFGDEYREYERKTRKWLPRVGL